MAKSEQSRRRSRCGTLDAYSRAAKIANRFSISAADQCRLSPRMVFLTAPLCVRWGDLKLRRFVQPAAPERNLETAGGRPHRRRLAVQVLAASSRAK